MNPPSSRCTSSGQWNHYRIEAIGPRLRVWINGAPAADVIDAEKPSGFIGLQVHSIEKPEDAGRTTTWKNLVIQTSNLKPLPPMGILIRNNLPNNLDAEEKAQGWRLLWVARPARARAALAAEGFPADGWSWRDGELSVPPKGGGGDIMTDEEFGAFELQMEFKVARGREQRHLLLPGSPHYAASGAPTGSNTRSSTMSGIRTPSSASMAIARWPRCTISIRGRSS